MKKKLIRFDWAIKYILRNKENFGIIEGFLTELLGQTITIQEILESESNKDIDTVIENRVDMVVKNQNGEFIIIEIQNTKESDYFHKMMFGAAKIVTEHVEQGQAYANVKKIISITIAYFDSGQGLDYVYHSKNKFIGVHSKDKGGETFPEYWIIKVDNFNDKISNPLDEWIYFLKNSAVLDEFTARGIHQAKEKLDELKMSEEERKKYQFYLKRLRDITNKK